MKAFGKIRLNELTMKTDKKEIVRVGSYDKASQVCPVRLALPSLLLCAFLCLFPAQWASARKFRSTDVTDLVLTYQMKHGEQMEVVKVGSLGMLLLKAILRADASDSDARNLRTALKKLHGVYIVDYSDLEQKVKDKFNHSLVKALSRSELIMEVKSDDGDRMEIYGVVSKNGRTVKDVFLLSREDGVLLGFTGTLDMESLSTIVNSDAPSVIIDSSDTLDI